MQTITLPTRYGDWTVAYRVDSTTDANEILSVTDTCGRPVPDRRFLLFMDLAEAAIEEEKMFDRYEAMCADCELPPDLAAVYGL